MKLPGFLSSFLTNIVSSIVSGILLSVLAVGTLSNSFLFIIIAGLITSVWILAYLAHVRKKKLCKFEDLGMSILEPDEYKTTEKAINDTDRLLRAMVFCGSKITATENFKSLLDQGKVKMLVVQPESRQSLAFSKARGATTDSIGIHTKANVELSKDTSGSVKFYPEDYQEWFRVIVVDEKYLHVSCYREGKTKEDVEIRIENRRNSLFRGFTELFEYLWSNGKSPTL